MKLYKALFIPALLLSGVFSSYADVADNNIAHDYVADWNEVMNGKSATSLQGIAVDPAIMTNCKTAAPKQFRSEIINQWQHKTGTKMTETAFLSEDLQLFDRLAVMSCLEGASHQHQGTGDLLVEALNAQLLDMNIKNNNDAYEQTKMMEFQTGIMTAKYGISIEKKRLNSGS